ncbi:MULTISPECIES: indoleacetamide hydrolase [unclassified Rhizobium]|uniref:indoleacetamide hydrolase n=1 Tax=unclassified Rhizobium TaxID=2613769 RepID=UPI0037FCCB85
MTLKEFTLTKASRAMAQGTLGSEELVTDLLKRHANLLSINAFVSLDADRALRDARQADADRASGRVKGPLHGLPIAFKDNINVKGYVTTGGTPSLRSFRPSKNAPIASRLLDAGAIAYGKNGMHELAYGATSDNPAFGAPRNPFDQTRTAGGSSGGSGAAVAARLVPASIGTDTGGSVRIPAAFCGAWGYRPTTGRWPAADVVPISTTRDTPGPVALSAADIVLLDSVVSGAPAITASAVKGVRFGIPHKHFWDMVDHEVAAVCMKALEKLKSEGAEVVEVDSEGLLHPYALSSMPISIYEGKVALSAFLAEHDFLLTFAEVAEQVASPDVRELLLAQLDPATAVSKESYDAATATHLPALKAAYADIFASNRIDALAFPICRMPAPVLNQADMIEINGKPFPIFDALIHNTDIGSAASLPGVSIPAGCTSAGLPVGLGLDYPFGNDAALLGLSLAIDGLFPALSPKLA